MLSHAFGVCVEGFTMKIMTCLVDKGNRGNKIGDRGRVYLGKPSKIILTDDPLPPAELTVAEKCKKAGKDVNALKPDQRSWGQS